MAEFLPLCDVLFNVISLAGYFCDIVFDMVFCYALLERGRTVYVGVVLLLVCASLVISQIVSLRWYLLKSKSLAAPTDPEASTTVANPDCPPNVKKQPATRVPSTLGRYCVIALHCSQLGVLWRYAKLFVPVDLRHVKHEVRDLCMLRLVHAFCEAAPMLLLQLHVLVTMQPDDYLIVHPATELQQLKSLGGSGSSAGTVILGAIAIGVGVQPSIVQPSVAVSPAPPSAVQQRQLSIFRDLNRVSAALSLFSVCWALASFSKNVRLQNVHRLVLTWLGVIFQFLWRLGTVVSRVTALTVYAALYGYWIFLVIVLHWFSMFLWLISPKNVFHGERISRGRKATLAALIACVYVFAYVNLQEVKHRQKMITFYVVMFLENWLLVCLWLVGVWPNRPDNWYIVPLLVLGSFLFGMAFMLLYYRYFHVRRLGYEAGGRFPGDAAAAAKYLHCTDTATGAGISDAEQLHVAAAAAAAAGGIGKNGVPTHAIPGVFNCRFSNPVGNGATKRKKKKPTTFVPPPTLPPIPSSGASQNSRGGGADSTTGSLADGTLVAGLMPGIPFWRRPLPRSNAGGSSENEGSAGSRVNIQQKLQEKKQKQLAELKIIEEEIKQGKLGGPASAAAAPGGQMDGGGGAGSAEDAARGSLLRQPIPRTKKHIKVEPIVWRSDMSVDGGRGGGGGCVGLAEGLLSLGASGSNGTAKAYNDLNVLSSALNLDEVNNLNKYTSNYDPLYNGFVGLNSINIPPAMGGGPDAFGLLDQHQQVRNLSPSISSQVSATESNSLTRCKMAPRPKMPLHNNGGMPPRNPFADTYRGAYPSVYADGANNNRSSPHQPSISPRHMVSGGAGGAPSTADSPNGRRGTSGHYLDSNHPRQISGTYSSSIENAGVDHLPFPYSVVPPPRSKLDSRQTPTAPAAATVAASQLLLLQQQQQQRVLALRQMQRAKTPEILLAPHYLDNSRIYYDWVTREPAYRLGGGGGGGGVGGHPDMQHAEQRHHRVSSGDENLDDLDDSVLGEGHQRGGGGHSDIDSQVSLPRSYTLPREFKYYRRNKPRKAIKNEHFIISTNSSDGDVDSGDDNESDDRQHPPTGGVSAAINQKAPSSRHPPNTVATTAASTANQSQRRLRQPTSAVRNHFHNHPATASPSVGGQQSPHSHYQQPLAMPHQILPQSVSATSSPLSHQSATIAAGSDYALVAATPASAARFQLPTRGVQVAVHHKPINQLDLIVGSSNAMVDVSNTATAASQQPIAGPSGGGGGGSSIAGAAHPNALNRQMRMRVYGNAAGMPRHETKL